MLPAARILAEVFRLGDSAWAVGAAFVLLGVLFAATGRTPTPHPHRHPLPKRDFLGTLVVPALLGFLYGTWHPDAPLWQRATIADSVFWYVVAVPIAEELVFRGGLYGALLRLRGDAPLSATNPLPVAVWASALAFALWHWDAGPAAVGRTFLLGLWLSWLRWRAPEGSVRRLAWPIAGHVVVNGAAILL